MLPNVGNTARCRQPFLLKPLPTLVPRLFLRALKFGRPPIPIRIPLLAFVLAVLFCGSHPLRAAGPPSASTPAAPKLEARIPVDPLGYGPPGALYLLSKLSFSSLDFLDSGHLLFTFREFRLLKREQDASSSEDDQMIRAYVLDLPSGSVAADAEWRMHDRDRYLWPLSGGRCLVRVRDSYWTTDASLRLRRWLESPTQVEATEVSPDGSLVAIESEHDQPAAEQSAESSPTLPLDAHLELPTQADRDTQISLLDVDSKVMQAAFRVELPIELPITSTGYLGVRMERSDKYAVRFIGFDGSQTKLGEVASTCRPHETFISAQAVLIESCGPSNPDLYLDTWTIGGKKLWSGRREAHNVWPTFATAENGSRFAIGMLRIDHLVNLADSLNDEDVKAQVVQVFDTDTGRLLLTTDASPIVSTGQNFALSPDGNLLAVLRRGAIEIYQVPRTPPASAAK